MMIITFQWKCLGLTEHFSQDIIHVKCYLLLSLACFLLNDIKDDKLAKW